MSVTGIILATVIVGGTGLLLGLFLGVADRKFKVEVDEKEIAVREALPGNNCGGCGFAGCDGLAKAIAQGEAKPNACPVGGAEAAAAIARIMGAEVGESKRMTAFVKCAGDCNQTTANYQYHGAMSCEMLSFVPSGGPKSCNHGCLGFGTCVRVCQFDAIHIVDGIAVVDKEKCKACGQCVAHCPKHLIEIVPYELEHLVACSSIEKGKIQIASCKAGCIGCRKCEKACPTEAITITNNVAHIDTDKCANCGVCALECPRKIITNIPKGKI